MPITVKKNATENNVFEIAKQTPNGTAYADTASNDLNPLTLLLESAGPKVTPDSMGMRRSRIKIQSREAVKVSPCADAECELRHITADLALSLPVGATVAKVHEQLHVVAQMLMDKSFAESLLVNGRTQYSGDTTITADA